MTFRILRAALLLAVCLITAPSFALSGRGTVITYQDEQNDRHIWFFSVHDKRLVSNHFDGTKWTWMDHGAPARDAGTLLSPEAVTYVDNAGKQRIYVFVSTGQYRLKLRYFNGYQWQWVDQGATRLMSSSAITYVDPDGNRRIHVFGHNPDTDHLGTNFWNGSQWLWADNGVLPGTTGSVNAEAITYVDGQGARRIDVFCACGVSANGSTALQLLVNSWSGSSWSWFNHGGTQVGEAQALTFLEPSGDRRIHVFVDGAGNTAQLHSRVDGSWYWINLAKPAAVPAGTQIDGLDAIAYVEPAGDRRMQAFYLFQDTIWSRSWNSAGWAAWMNHGFPPGVGGVSNPVAISYYDSRINSERIHLFANCSPNLCDHVYNGSTWQWQVLGSPPD